MVQLNSMPNPFHIVPVLGCLGCYNKIPQIGQLIYNWNVFVTVLESGNLRSGCQHGQVRAFFWGCRLLIISSHDKMFSCASFIRALTSSVRALLSWPNHCLQAQHWALGFQHVKFQADTNTQTIAVPYLYVAWHYTLMPRCETVHSSFKIVHILFPLSILTGILLDQLGGWP